MAEQHPPLSDEMLSAYLDGELSDQQRQQVEDVLRRDADWRNQYDQLKSVRDSLRELPRHALDEGFSARVLQRIRSASEGSQRPNAAGAKPSSREDRPPRGFRRGLVWAALAVAVAVMLMVVPRPDGEPGDQVAQVPAEAKQERAAAKSLPVPPGDVAVESADNAPARSKESRSESPVDRPAVSKPQLLPDRGAAVKLPEDVRQSAELGRVAEFHTVLQFDVSPDQLVQIESRLQQDLVPIVRRLADRDSIRAAMLASDNVARRSLPEIAGANPTGREFAEPSSAAPEAADSIVGLVIEASEHEVRDVLQSAHVQTNSTSGMAGDLFSFRHSGTATLKDGITDDAKSGPTSDSDSADLDELHQPPQENEKKVETRDGRELDLFALPTTADETPRTPAVGRRSAASNRLAVPPDGSKRVLLLFRLIEPNPSLKAGDISVPRD